MKQSSALFTIIHGPNLNELGSREVNIYGTETLDNINKKISAHARKRQISTDFFQSNHEGDIIDKIHTLKNGDCKGMIINGAAFTHTSIAIRDAVSCSNIPTVEVHLSNIHAREPFRTQSYLTAVCIGIISGFGSSSYTLAVDALVEHLNL